MMYQIVRCPHCSRVYSGGIYREKTASPIATCRFCWKPFLDKTVNEWELRGIFGKIFYVLATLFEVAVTGFLSAMLVLFLIILPDLIFKTEFSAFMLDDVRKYIGLIIVCTLINLVRVIIRERKDFAASRTRMADLQYREILQTAGLLK